MTQLAAALPELQHQATREAAPRMALLEGASDAIAGAALQSAVQDMAGAVGASLTSIGSSASCTARQLSTHWLAAVPRRALARARRVAAGS